MTYVDLSARTKEEIIEYSKRPPAFDPPARLLVTQESFDALINENQFEVINGFNYLRDYPVTTSSENQIPQRPKPAPDLTAIKRQKRFELKMELTEFVERHMPSAEQIQLLALWTQVLVKKANNQQIDTNALDALEERLEWAGNGIVLSAKIDEDLAAAATIEDVENLRIDYTTIRTVPPRVPAGRMLEAIRGTRAMGGGNR